MQTLTDSDTIDKARRATAEYLAVFGERPDLEFVPSGDTDCIVLSGWLWLYRSDGDRWTVRVLLPNDPWFAKFDCLRRKDGYTVEKPSFDDALVYLFQHETHRRCHAAREDWRCNR